MAVAKKKKNRPKRDSAGATLDQMESRSSDLAEWITEHPLPIVASAGVILAIAAAYTLASSSINNANAAASASIAAVQSEYRAAMGGDYFGSLGVPEPANPETARTTRLEYVEQFKQIATAQKGNESASQALIHAGSLQVELDDLDGALASFQQALEPYDASRAMRGIILERIAAVHEQLGDLPAAITAHLEASKITRYPLRYFALLNAARSQAEAGDAAAAVVSFDRITQESPDLLIPEHTQAMLLELKVQQSR